MEHGAGRGEEGVGGHDDVATGDPDGAQDDLEGARAAADRHRKGRLVTGPEGFLEGFRVGPERQRAGAERLVDKAQHGPAVLVGEDEAGSRYLPHVGPPTVALDGPSTIAAVSRLSRPRATRPPAIASRARVTTGPREPPRARRSPKRVMPMRAPTRGSVTVMIGNDTVGC